ncbi:acyltransferase [Spongiactinospora sp. TRM90649]|uniref:acyltransferase family protein n=1 Tax=Spongiactinospora sp. TRM90649 TaxID=3031114 RepID=UPI0023F8B052|nr:acyltransferase [Spongiactinospora sp. TRM90649]MDF5752922.1 acyltransferase [Spongiactinospora sp. TRM90649]
MVTASPVSATVPVSAPHRLAWLDCLRGVAALAVVAEHMLPWVAPTLRPYWFNLGMYGVLVFFLVSGYIIPASLERKGDIRSFWISRIFRLYPLYLLIIAVVFALSWWVPVRSYVTRDPSAVAAHVTMLHDTLNEAAVVDTMWTLSYEMVFYLLVTALFVAGLHRRSGGIAIVFGAAAIVAGLLLDAPLLQGAWPAYASFGLFAVGMVCLISGRLRATAAYVLGAMAVVLLMTGSYVPWLGAAILASMFAGTAIYRWERKTGPLWPVFATAALISVSTAWSIQAGWWWVRPQAWITTIALAGVTFALGMAVRNRRIPKVLAWLGLVSYSVYLVHHPVLKYVLHVTGSLENAAWPVQTAAAIGILAAVLGISWVTYRLVEAPMQRLGRRVAKRYAV